MTLEEARDLLAAALRRAVTEHGAPNRFTCAELYHMYGGPPPAICGRLARFSGSVSASAGMKCRYDRLWIVDW